MPLRGTALKRWKLAERNRRRNQAVKSELKTRISHFRKALRDGQPEAADLLHLALRRIDRAATKGAIHPRNAARKKSRLQSLYNRVAAGEAPEAVVETVDEPEDIDDTEDGDG
jgi:small subunit ribosomal protein S20